MTIPNTHKTISRPAGVRMGPSGSATISKTRFRLYTGFTALLLLFILPIGIGLNLLQNAETNISTIVNQHNVKTELVSSMLNAARSRSLLLYEMVNIKDAFERDEIYQKVRTHGANFANSRAQMLEMKLTTEELNLLKEFHL